MPKTDPHPATDIHRLRIRFRKDGQLRWIGHHDLMRTFERLLRRALLPLKMTSGYHPKPRMRFPSALALGIAGHNEVLEVDLREPIDAAAAQARLAANAPAGLTIRSAEPVPPGAPKARIRTLTYRFPVPAERAPQVADAIESLRHRQTLLVNRGQPPQPVELPLELQTLRQSATAVEFCLRETHQAAMRPRDIVTTLGLDDLEQEGYYLQRTAVELMV